MKTKFKIGDKVKVILNSIFQGETGKIFEIRNDIVEVEMLDTNHLFFCEDEIKLLPKQKKITQEVCKFTGCYGHIFKNHYCKLHQYLSSKKEKKIEPIKLKNWNIFNVINKINELVDAYNNDRRNK